MKKPLFLEMAQVIRLHRSLLERYGGPRGIRDLGLLASALDQPRAMFDGAYLHAGLFEMAAAYCFHIVRNHPFVDGKKRTGASAAIVFLDLNGVTLKANQDGLYTLILSLAAGSSGKPECAEFFRERAQSR